MVAYSEDIGVDLALDLQSVLTTPPRLSTMRTMGGYFLAGWFQGLQA